MGLNVWVENNELLMYLSQSGTFDENNQMLKHGRVRIRMEPNPFEEAVSFSQELRLEEGCIYISAANDRVSADLELWVDVERPVAHVKCSSNVPVEVYAQYESWRTEDQELPPGTRHACFSYTSYPGEVVKYKDQVGLKENIVQWMHRNRDDKLLIDFCIRQQGLEEVLRIDIRDFVAQVDAGQIVQAANFTARLQGELTTRDICLQLLHLQVGLRTHQATP